MLGKTYFELNLQEIIESSVSTFISLKINVRDEEETVNPTGRSSLKQRMKPCWATLILLLVKSLIISSVLFFHLFVSLIFVYWNYRYSSYLHLYNHFLIPWRNIEFYWKTMTPSSSMGSRFLSAVQFYVVVFLWFKIWFVHEREVWTTAAALVSLSWLHRACVYFL